MVLIKLRHPAVICVKEEALLSMGKCINGTVLLHWNFLVVDFNSQTIRITVTHDVQVGGVFRLESIEIALSWVDGDRQFACF